MDRAAAVDRHARRGGTAWALAEFSIIYLPMPFILVGTLYAIAARVIAPLLIIALGSGLITFAFAWFWGDLGSSGGPLVGPAGVFLALAIAVAVALCWWLSRGRRALVTALLMLALIAARTAQIAVS